MRVTHQLDRGRNGWLATNAGINAVIGVTGLIGLLIARQRGLYAAEDQVAWLIGAAIGLALLLVALAQWLRPLRYWELSALPLWLLLASLPTLLTQAQVDSKEPSFFIQAHLDRLRQADVLLGNDAGLSANLAWELKRTDITVYASQGELAYGLSTPAGAGRFVSRGEIASWIESARRRGSIALVLRISDADDPDLAALPEGSVERDVRNRLALVFYPRATTP